ncbi:MAG: penicillin-binding protein beta-lactamase class [Ilumatobacteraceae bacterium]|jgi:CubicO group peptidase (beta-lactamase class C family)|nr:penicillin-binding protein beta-lactamase class [Ilumatobacteraceae bacterium]
MGIDQAAVEKLVARARREVDDGLLPSAQVALAYDDELVLFETFGDATDDTRYVVYSATKAFVAGAVWALIGDDEVDVSKLVVDYIPEFGTNGKDVITVEQVMLHTSGFPLAPLSALQGDTSAGRVRAFAKWRLNWEPGTKYQYHPTAAHWVLAEIIERVTGKDFRDVVQARVTDPAGLPRVVGDVPWQAAELQLVGEPATPDELEAAFGVRELDLGEVTLDALLGFNDPAVQRVGVPGGGGVMRACDLAMYYQAILHNPGEMWRPDVIDDVRSNVRNHLPDVMTGVPANRTLGLIQAGGDGKSNWRGMGHTVSPIAVGHNGAKGQIAFGDPATGLSFGFTTNGLDENDVREPRRTSGIASAAARCATP